MGPTSNASALIRHRRGDPYTDEGAWRQGRGWSDEPQTKDCLEPPRVGGVEGGSPRAQRERSPAHTLISDSGLQSCERTNLCHCKSPSLWQFITMAFSNHEREGWLKELKKEAMAWSNPSYRKLRFIPRINCLSSSSFPFFFLMVHETQVQLRAGYVGLRGWPVNTPWRPPGELLRASRHNCFICT